MTVVVTRANRWRPLGLGLAAALLGGVAPGALAQDASPDALARAFAQPPETPLPDRANQVLTSPGFSHTGDPRVQPAEAMKKVSWSVVHAQGGRPVPPLPMPSDVAGPFPGYRYGNQSPWADGVDRPFYHDALVLAYRAAPSMAATPVAVRSSAGPVDMAGLSAASPAHPFVLASHDGTAWMELDYGTDRTVRTVSLGTPEFRIDTPMVVEVAARRAGGGYLTVATIDLRESTQATVSFAPVTARTFRLTFRRRPMSYKPVVPYGGADVTLAPTAIPFFRQMRQDPGGFPIARLALEGGGAVSEWERKAGFFTFVDDYYALATPAAAVDRAVAKADVVDLTGRMRADGSLDWTPPAGDWTVVRLGYSLTGQTNHPAPPDQTGLEVDKLDAAQMRRYLDRHLDGAVAKGRTRYLFADSIEAGPQNWTDALLPEFRRRRGYDPLPYLPTLTGVVVGSAADSDRFLWDWRATIGELFQEATYRTIAEAGHARGLTVMGEALETGRHSFGDDFEMRRYADIPMGALWASSPLADYPRDYPNEVADQRGAASVAHLLGRPLVIAESATDLEHPGAFSPRALKPIVDLEFALGMNVVPARGGPGPGEPWAAYAGDWSRYLDRTGWMLRQGSYVADVAYLYGQEGPLVAQREKIDDTPRHNGFDFVSAPLLMDGMTVQGGMLVAPSGLRYRALQLGGQSGRLTVPLLRRLAALVDDGLSVVGRAPVESPSLADDPAEFARLRTHLWGADGRGGPVGKGHVYGTATIDAALATMGAGADVASRSAAVGDDLLFVHRRLPAADAYYLVSRVPSARSVTVSFRQTGRVPELWRADTGERTPLSYRTVGGTTQVSIDLRPSDAAFVVFAQSAARASSTVPAVRSTVVQRIDGPWSVAFPGARGAPGQRATLPAGSWTESADPAVRYFAGTASYTRTIDGPRAADAGARTILSLGEVRDLAELFVNGTSAGVRLSAPYRFDVTGLLHPGANTVEVRVTNLAVNAMIGAARAGKAAGGGGFGLVQYKPDAPLRPSGLIGPVTLLRETGSQSRPLAPAAPTR